MIFFSGHSQQDEAAGGSAGLSRERAIEGYRESWAVNRKYWDDLGCLFSLEIVLPWVFRDFCCSAIRRVLIKNYCKHDSPKIAWKMQEMFTKTCFFPLQGCQVDWRFRVQTLFCKDKRGGMRNLIPTAGLSKGELGGVFWNMFLMFTPILGGKWSNLIPIWLLHLWVFHMLFPHCTS